jgi:elongation factor G
MEAYLEGEEPSMEKLKELIRKGTINSEFVPVFCGSAFKNKGVQPLLDAVVDYLPSPIDVPAIKGIDPKTEEDTVRKASDEEPLSCWHSRSCQRSVRRFADFLPHLFRRSEQGVSLLNTVKDKRERVGRMMQMHSNSREDIDVAYAGDIVAIAGLKDTTTGDTLCDPLKPVILERMEFPEPVIEIAVEPKTKADQEKMGLALNRLAAEDPSFRVKTDEESGQTIIAGMGELHLDIIVDRMKREFKVEANIGAPQVAYRETITKVAEVDYTHKKQSGGSGQFARVKLVIEPSEPNEGYVFESKIVGGSVPKEYIPGVTKGMKASCRPGSADRLPDARHQGDPHRRCLPRSGLLGPRLRNRRPCRFPRRACQKAGPKLLEPVMKVEVVTPEDYHG